MDKNCEFTVFDQGLCLRVDWPNDRVKIRQLGAIQIQIFDDPAEPKVIYLKEVELSAELKMPDMGHGTTPVKVEKVLGGFLLSQLNFLMSGYWELEILIKVKNRVERHFYPIRCDADAHCFPIYSN